MESLFHILDHLATHRRKLILMEGWHLCDRSGCLHRCGGKPWRIEDLWAQAKADARSEKHRDAVLDRAYTWADEDGKVVIRRNRDVIFFEPGWEG